MNRQEFDEGVQEFCHEFGLSVDLMDKEVMDLAFEQCLLINLDVNGYTDLMRERHEKCPLWFDRIKPVGRELFDEFALRVAREIDGIDRAFIDDFTIEYREEVETFWETAKVLSVMEFRELMTRELILRKLHKNTREMARRN